MTQTNLTDARPKPKLGVMLGAGETALYVAAALRRMPELDVVFLSMPGAEAGQKVPGAFPLKYGFVDLCVRYLASREVTDAFYVGHFDLLPNSTVIHQQIGELLDRYEEPPTPLLETIEPSETLQILEDELREAGITLHGALDYLPQLRAKPDFSLGNVPFEEEARANFEEAVAAAAMKSPLESAQAFIVDGGIILAKGTAACGTNQMILDFAGSDAAKHANRPMLCKVASPHFRGLYPPVVGDKTAQLCVEHGIKGIIVEAETTLVHDQDLLTERAKPPPTDNASGGDGRPLFGDVDVARDLDLRTLDRFFFRGALWFCVMLKEAGQGPSDTRGFGSADGREAGVTDNE